MFQCKKIVTQLNYYMKYITPRPITALKRSAIRKTTRKTTNDKISKSINFLANMLKEEKKEQILTTHKNLYENAYCPTNKTSVTT